MPAEAAPTAIDQPVNAWPFAVVPLTGPIEANQGELCRALAWATCGLATVAAQRQGR